jgi:hypothetical protein
MDRLVAELRERGLHVAAKLPVLAVMKPAVSGQDPQVQQVLIRNCECHGFTWYWVRPGRRPALLGEPMPPPQVEPMCPAEEIRTAADRISNVVGLCSPELAIATRDT